MKSMFKRVKSFALIFICLFSLFGCAIGDAEVPPAYSGIHITPDRPISDTKTYSEETESYARRVIAEILSHYATEASVEAFFGSAKQSQAAEKIQKITAENLIAEEKYISFIAAIENSGAEVIDEILDGGTAKSKELYLKLSKDFGIDYLSRTLYKLLIWVYEYSYDKSMAEYEQYGYSYKLDDANKALADKATLITDIGEEKFVLVAKSALILPELLFGGASQSEMMDSFTDEEILIFLSYTDFSSLNMSDSGWSLVLSLFAPKSNTKDTPYVQKLLYTMNNEGDTANVAAIMNDFMSLFSFVQKSLGTNDVHLLRNGARDEVLNLAFGKFGKNEWDLFESITTIKISSSKYESQARRVFGDDFTSYKNTVKTNTLAELRDSVGTDNFYKTLEGYIAGITPAFSYGMNK